MILSLRDGDFLVLSDLHIGHQASQLQDVAVLAPLFTPGRTIIFNGDTFEMRRAVDRARAGKWVEDLKNLLRDCGSTGLFINGNHDPVASDINHVECPETGVLITHGDVLFQNIAPWSLNERLYRRAHQEELAQLPEGDKLDLAARLSALRRATQSYDISHPTVRPGLAGSAVHFLETAWPPWRPLRIIKSWAEIPGRAENFTKTYRPAARTLLIGHSHLAGIWQKNGLRIINTGAAISGFRPRGVRFENGRMTVQRIIWSEKKLHLGPIIRTFATSLDPLAPTAPQITAPGDFIAS